MKFNRRAAMAVARRLHGDSAAHAEVIEPDSVAGQNIQVAASFIRANGNPKLANNILRLSRPRLFLPHVDDRERLATLRPSTTSISIRRW